MPKFFVEPENIDENYIYIRDEDVNHAIKVLRLCTNDIIMVCDGNGNDYKVAIEDINKKALKTKILDKFPVLTEPPVNVILYQGIPKASKLEYIIQKTVELGISKIVPVVTQRTVVKLEDKKTIQNKLQRWNKIAYEAVKQSNRGKIPQVAEPIDFFEAITQIQKLDIGIMPYEKENANSLRKIFPLGGKTESIGVFIGPEGGFEQEEVEKACQAGLHIVGLGPRILRTETAGAAVLSILMYETGGI